MVRAFALLTLAVSLGCGSAASREGTHSRARGPADAGAGADAGTDAGTTAGETFLPLRRSPIADENQRPGGQGWRLHAASNRVAAYADRTSALPGDPVVILAGAESATAATWQLWRIGYYNGAGGRKLGEGSGSIAQWTAPVLDPATGAVRANWPAAFVVPVPRDAVTGAYLVRIATAMGETYATFVVREPLPGAPILYPMSTNTYHAYNGWGGTSLYENRRSDWGPWHAYAVSFDRPYAQDNGVGELFSKDRSFIFFAESQGYDIAYVTDTDLDREPELVHRRRLLLFQGHSEYWSENMRDAAETAVQQGTNLVALAANTAYWQVRYADPSRRLLIAYKEFASLDPAGQADRAHLTGRWRDAPLLRPENAFLGEMFGSWQWNDAPATVTDPSSWIWAGADVSAGAIIPGLYGDESDTRFDNGEEPPGVTVMASAMVEDHSAKVRAAETSLYQARSGAWVFSAGSITWGAALSAPGNWDARVQQAVANLFSRLAGDGTLGPAALHPLNLPAPAPQPQYRDDVRVTTVTRSLTLPVAVAAAGADAIVVDQDRIVRVTRAGVVTPVAGSTRGFVDGPAEAARFAGPRGIAVAADGTIYVSDTGNFRIRAISAGTVRTVAGSRFGFADGNGPLALFAGPMGIALTASGAVLVADAWNHRLRQVTPAGAVTTWAGGGAKGILNGPGASAALNFPIAVTVLPSGDAVLVESATGALRRVSAAATHEVTVLAGGIGAHGWADGPAQGPTVSETVAVAAMPDGQLAFIDGASARIRALRAGTIDTLAGGRHGGTLDGAGPEAGFAWPRALAAAGDGSLWVVDASEHALRRITFPP